MKYNRNIIIFLSFLFFASNLVQISGAVGPIPDTKEKYPSWSPDGQKILFFSGGAMSEGIFIVRPDATDLIKMDPYAGDPSWSPDGKKIILLDVFENESEGPVGIDIVELDLNTETTTRLTFNGNSLEESNPKYSPDGKQIVFEDSNGIYVINSDGTELKKLVGSSAGSPEWSPDSKEITYYTFDDLIEIWMINSDGTNKKKIFIDYRYSIGGKYRWTPDSKYLLLNNGSNIITKVNIDKPADIEYIYDPVAHWNPKYSPDGNFVTFVSNMDGGDLDLFVARSNGSDLYMIVFDTNLKPPVTPDYFSKKSRPTPPPWPTPEPTPDPTATQTPAITSTAISTATSTPAVPGFSILLALLSIALLVLAKKSKR